MLFNIVLRWKISFSVCGKCMLQRHTSIYPHYVLQLRVIPQSRLHITYLYGPSVKWNTVHVLYIINKVGCHSSPSTLHVYMLCMATTKGYIPCTSQNTSRVRFDGAISSYEHYNLLLLHLQYTCTKGRTKRTTWLPTDIPVKCKKLCGRLVVSDISIPIYHTISLNCVLVSLRIGS